MSKWVIFLCMVTLLAACKSPPPPQDIPAEPEPEPIEFQDPQFTITAIAILQEDLINTRFRVKLTIDNPNIFPITIVSFSYELYGDGRFWAGGRDTKSLLVPAGDSLKTSLDFEMNFINMKRQLLDDIIAMRQVRYRFTGNVEVDTGMAHIPPFNVHFELSGVSDVEK